MKKKWIAGLVTGVIIAILAFLGLVLFIAMNTTIKYGTPHYRPKVD
jgi:succinate dehydrogenase hydrophobic anchor subunit